MKLLSSKGVNTHNNQQKKRGSTMKKTDRPTAMRKERPIKWLMAYTPFVIASYETSIAVHTVCLSVCLSVCL
jgi:hypothetical protein